MVHICVRNLTIIGSDNGLSQGQRQAIIWTNARILLIIWNLGTNFSEIFSENHTFSSQKIHLKMLSAKWRPSCLGLSVLKAKKRVGGSPVKHLRTIKGHVYHMFRYMTTSFLWKTSAYTSGSPHNVPVLWSFDIFFGASLNKLLAKQLSCRWFTIPWRSYDILVWT